MFFGGKTVTICLAKEKKIKIYFTFKSKDISIYSLILYRKKMLLGLFFLKS